MALGVTKDPLPQTTFERVVKDVLPLSGYFGPATVHAIPRGLGQKLDGKLALETCAEISLISGSCREVHRGSATPAPNAERHSACGRSGFLDEEA